MTRVALDTASDRASVALETADGRVYAAHVDGARRHAAALLPLLDRLLDEAGVRLDGLRQVVVADGPGSFTGLRVGVAVAKALALSRDAALWTAPSLLARAARAEREDGALVVAASDALRGEVYAAAYRFEGGQVIVEQAPAVWHPAELRVTVPRPAVLVADLPLAVAQALSGWAERTVGAPAAAPRAEDLLALARRAGAARRVDDVHTWEPEYGRPAEAQARWERAHGRPLPDPTGDPA